MKRLVTSPFAQKQLFSMRNPFLKYSKLFSCTNEPHTHSMNLIRKQAPQFASMSWWKDDFKKVSLEDFKGKWVCLFFYPLDFTFVCPTEIVDFDTKATEFSNLSKQIIFRKFIDLISKIFFRKIN